jgi:hypothetical protein
MHHEGILLSSDVIPTGTSDSGSFDFGCSKEVVLGDKVYSIFTPVESAIVVIWWLLALQ